MRGAHHGGLVRVDGDRRRRKGRAKRTNDRNYALDLNGLVDRSMTGARRLTADVENIRARAPLRGCIRSALQTVAGERVGRHVDDRHDMRLRAPAKLAAA